MRELVQMRWSNTMPGFLQDLRNPEHHPLKKILAALGNKEAPYYATSDLPFHALRYAYGQKPDKNLKPWRLRPRFQTDGVTKRCYPGKIFVYLFTAEELEKHKPNHVIDMHWQGLVDIGSRIIPERETTFAGGILHGCAFLEEDAKIPSFTKYRPYYSEKYGLSLQKFNEFKNKLIESEPGSQTKRKREQHKVVKNEIINFILSHHQQDLEQRAHGEVVKRGGYLIYQGLDGLFSITPPSMDEVRRGNKQAKKTSELVRNDDTSYVGITRNLSMGTELSPQNRRVRGRKRKHQAESCENVDDPVGSQARGSKRHHHEESESNSSNAVRNENVTTGEASSENTVSAATITMGLSS